MLGQNILPHNIKILTPCGTNKSINMTGYYKFFKILNYPLIYPLFACSLKHYMGSQET